MTILYIFILVGIPVFYLVVIYNRLVTDKHRVLSGWSDIDVQLKRRHDLIPKLITAIRQYARYEQSTLQALMELRKQAANRDSINERGKLESKLSLSLFSISAIAEDYPDLKTNQGYLDLQTQISQIEEDIHFARRYYNGAVNNLNTRIDSFPDLIVARLLKFKAAEYFELDSPS